MTTPPAITPTPELLAILDALRSTSANLIIEAVAGGGKTTTIIECCRALGPGRSILFLAFNKDIATILQQRLPYYATASTFHSFCFDALRRKLGGKIKVDAGKSRRRLAALVSNTRDRRAVADDVLALVAFAKCTTYDPNQEHELKAIAEAQDLDVTQTELDLAADILFYSAQDTETIDFDDMLWLTYHQNVPLPSPAFLFLDEAQDTNEVQRVLIRRAAPSRFIAVGDPHQSIYGFRGASHDAMTALRTDFSMTPLPLSVSYRCSQAVVAEARKYL